MNLTVDYVKSAKLRRTQEGWEVTLRHTGEFLGLVRWARDGWVVVDQSGRRYSTRNAAVAALVYASEQKALAELNLRGRHA